MGLIVLETNDLIRLMEQAYTLGTQEWFWSRVKPDVGPKDCAVWTGPPHSMGYGSVTRMVAGYQGEPSNRVAHELALGPLPDGYLACHTCDNRPCCRPDHLFAGTYQDNMDDMWAKGRAPLGSARSNALLTEDQVRDIRRRARPRKGAPGETWTALAREYGVSLQAIEGVVLRHSWKHVA